MNHSRNLNAGFTIVELMITLAITSVLALGAVTFIAGANKSNQVQSAISGLNVSGRFGLEQIARDIRMSGYRDSNWTFGALGDSVAAENRDSASGGDVIRVLFEAPRDCGFNLAPGGVVTNVYRVNDGSLECNDQAIAEGVDEMQVWFGEDLDNDGVANRWVPPHDDVIMTNVVSVRIHLLVVTDGNDIATSPTHFYFNDNKHEAIDDGQIRREYTSTIALRNPI